MPRKQVNIGFAPEDYEELQEAASAAGQDVTGFVRTAALAAMRPQEPASTPTPVFDPMDLIRVGYVLAEAQHAQRPRWWQFWRRGQQWQAELGQGAAARQAELAAAVDGALVE